MEPRHEDIGAYGGKLTAGEWFNWLWRELRHADVLRAVEEEPVTELIKPLCEYALAFSFERWALSADVDIEPRLAARIDKAKSNGVADKRLPTDLPDMSGRFNLFDADTLLDDWIMERARWASSSYDRSHSSMGRGNPIIWMSGEKGPLSRPEFKEEAFFIYLEEMYFTMDYVYEALCSGVSFSYCLAEDVSAPLDWTHGKCRDVAREELAALDGDGRTYIITCKDRDSGYPGLTLLAEMACLGLLPDDATGYLLVDFSAYYDMTGELAAELGQYRFRMLLDDSGKLGNAVLDAGELFPEDAEWWNDDRGTFRAYAGELPARFEGLAGAFPMTEALYNLVTHTVERLTSFAGSYCASGRLMEALLPRLTMGRYSISDAALPPIGRTGMHVLGELVSDVWLGKPSSDEPRAYALQELHDIEEIWSEAIGFKMNEDHVPLPLGQLEQMIDDVDSENGVESQLDALFNGVPLEDIIGTPAAW